MRYRVRFDRGTAWVQGPKAEARRRLAACGDANPVWSKTYDAWATSPAAANGLVDQLEARRLPVTVENVEQIALDLSETIPANRLPDRPEGLW